MILKSFLAVVAIASLGVEASHEVTFTNKCNQHITPKWKAGSGQLHSGRSLAKGESGHTSLPEGWNAGRLYGQNGKCVEPDGAGCTLFECSFGTPGYHQCNLSLVSGFNVGMAFRWVNPGSGCQPGKSCPGRKCGPANAWYPPDTCHGCLSQCNTEHVGMHVTFCPDSGDGFDSLRSNDQAIMI